MKKKLLFKLFIFAVIGAFVTVTSCKDYDDDISRLEEQSATKTALDAAIAELNSIKTQIATLPTDGDVATAVAAAKTEAINAAVAAATEAVNSATADLEEELEDLAGLITVLQGDVTALGVDLDAALVEIAANKAAIALQQAILDKYLTPGTPDSIVDAIAAIQAELATAGADLDALSDKIDDIDATLNVLNFAKINNMITEVTFDYQGDDVSERWNTRLDFTTTKARVDYTFGTNNAILFKIGERQATEGITLTVKVSPANAELSVDQIKLIRSDANAQINNFLTVSKVERANPLLTRATPTVTGLWDITFELPTSANLTEFTKLIQNTAGTSSYLFALAIENTVDAAEDADNRFVISDFAISLSADDVAPIYNDQDYPNDLVFQVRSNTAATWTNHAVIANRYGITEPVSATKLRDKRWDNAWSATGTPADDGNDDRSGQPLLNVEVGKEFNVRLSGSNADDIYAYYITMDKEYAYESYPSEINAWNAYEPAIEGLNTVLKADEVAKLKINATTAQGDVIGFRVYAVNWDGTLVDPDGKSFYVGVGASASSTLAFKQTITNVMTAGVAVDSDILAFASVAGVTTAEFTMNLEHNTVLSIANIRQYSDATGATITTDWAATKSIQIVGAIPAHLKENTPYTGTLTLKNAAGISVFVQNITLQKVLPSADLGITYKTSIHHNVAGEQVVYGYPLPSGYYDVTTALNVPATMNNLVVTNNSTYATASLPVWNIAAAFGNTAANVPTAEIGVPYLPTAAPGHGKIYSLTISRNFGPVKYDATNAAGADYLLNWNGTPALKVEFRSFIQDLYDWKFATVGTVLQTPTLVYGETPATAYALTNITALPPAGPRIDMTNTTPALQDGRTFTIAAVELLTGANFDVVNEYFTPTLGATSITFTPVITSTPAGPVPTKLRLTLTDDFGHDYEFVVPQSFNMTLN